MREVEFRDGARLVHDHVADNLAKLDTYLITYDEAMAQMNDKFLIDRLQKAQGDAVRQHFARYPKA